MTTIKIKLPLVDERACTGCPMLGALGYAYCSGFEAILLDRVKMPGGLKHPRRLPQCIEATVNESEVRDA